jgi:SEC-C motif-containing protein
VIPASTGQCPCGSGEPFGRCCLAVHRGERQAATAEELMRARYSAYAVGDLDFLWRSWHPGSRPTELTPNNRLTWIGLEILDTVDGGPEHQTGEVEFRAHYREPEESGGTGTLHERSRFAVRARRWLYVDGDLFT